MVQTGNHHLTVSFLKRMLSFKDFFEKDVKLQHESCVIMKIMAYEGNF